MRMLFADSVIARLARPWNPTHTHADGNAYELLGRIPHKVATQGWRDALVYRDSMGAIFSTSETRWQRRFKPISL